MGLRAQPYHLVQPPVHLHTAGSGSWRGGSASAGAAPVGVTAQCWRHGRLARQQHRHGGCKEVATVGGRKGGLVPAKGGASIRLGRLAQGCSSLHQPNSHWRPQESHCGACSFSQGKGTNVLFPEEILAAASPAQQDTVAAISMPQYSRAGKLPRIGPLVSRTRSTSNRHSNLCLFNTPLGISCRPRLLRAQASGGNQPSRSSKPCPLLLQAQHHHAQCSCQHGWLVTRRMHQWSTQSLPEEVCWQQGWAVGEEWE